MSTQDETYLTLHKYWLQANLMRVNFHRIIDTISDITQEEHSSPSMTYMDLWLSSLHTVINGYKKQDLQYDDVDHLLITNQNGFSDLKKYRDSTFHFEIPEERKLKLKKLKSLDMLWADQLQTALGNHLLIEVKQRTSNIIIKNKVPVFTNTNQNDNLKPLIKSKANTNLEISLYWLTQYWLRANLMKSHFYNFKVSEKLNIEKVIYLGSWYSLLCCVIEGYLKLNYSDKAIDSLLDSKNYFNLVKYRHAFTGYHKDYNNNYLLDGFLKNATSVIWVRNLHDSFRQFLRNETKQILETLHS